MSGAEKWQEKKQPLKKKRRRPGSRQPKFKRKPRGRMKGDYTYQPKAKPRASKVNAATAIISNSSHADSKTDVEGPTLSIVDQRNFVSLYYFHLGAPPPEEWNGEGGTVSKIVRALSYGKDQHRRVKEVITDYHFTILVGGKYNPQRKSRTNHTTAIEDGSHVQQLVCNYIESGVSLTEAQLLINIWCIKHGECTVTRSAVFSCVQRLKKKVSLIKKHPQGHTDPKSDWARCRFRFAAQMLLRFGEDLSETSIFLTNFLTRRAIYHLASIQISSLSWILTE